jgi:hypothetical protein
VLQRILIGFGAAALFAALSAAPGQAASGPESPRGFGNIPFGAKKERALDLNAGNGRLTENPDKTATFTYTMLVSGLAFDVAQNFDQDGKAIDVKLTYSSRELGNVCIDRFNYVLQQLNARYGKPRAPPALRREDAGGVRTDVYSVEFVFADQAAIKADVTTGYALPQPAGGAGAAPAQPAAAGVGPSCGIALQYLPPRWIAQF